MQTIQKAQIADFLLIQAMHEERQLKEQVAKYEAKYGVSFEQFEQTQKSNTTEDFEQYDDYIDWKASTHFYQEALKKLMDIQHGDFQFA